MEWDLLSSMDVTEYRRETSRISLRVNIEYEGFERFKPDKALNLSCGGLFVLTRSPLKLGDQVYVRFDLPDLNQNLTLLSKVVWIPGENAVGAGERHPGGMGLEFQIDFETRQLLDQYVVITQAQSTLDARIGQEKARSMPRFLRFSKSEGRVQDLPTQTEIEAFFQNLDKALPTKVYDESDTTPVTPFFTK